MSAETPAKKNYKDTVRLPKTDFPMKADLVTREPQRLAKWEAGGLYQRIMKQSAGRPKFVLHDGPPFANGDVHMGTALNKVLKDIIVKSKTMAGHHAPFIPGWDCHGLPIEFKVVKEAKDLAPAEIRTRSEAYARKFIDIQRQSFKRLGIFGDWENPYLTLTPGYEADIMRTFAKFVEKGLVYRAKRPVQWSYGAQTALAEAEVEYKEKTSPAIYVKFAVLTPGFSRLQEDGYSLVIWTTTPWTLPANLGIALHPDFEYTAGTFAHEDGRQEKLILANSRLEAFSASTGFKLDESRPTTKFKGSTLKGAEAQHPFLPRGSKVINALFVTNDTGTGAVHMAPGHGADDYIAGKENGLEVLSPVDDQGNFTAECGLPEFVGQHVFKSNEGIIAILEGKGALLGNEKYVHQYPHCWRSKTPIIFRAVEQFFIRINDFRQDALKAIDTVNWLPAWGRNRIHGTVESRPDWCISRQRTWGVPLPVFYAADGSILMEGEISRKVADAVELHGTNLWFEKDDAFWCDLIGLPEGSKRCKDTLDVWIDSGSSSVAVLERHPELYCPADVYIEGTDQHRGWFQSSLMVSVAVRGTAPYKTVITNGFVVDTSGKKISKSDQEQQGDDKGKDGKDKEKAKSGKPMTAEHYFNKYGSDMVRLWAASVDYQNDVPFSEELFQQTGESYRRIRNTFRVLLGNLNDEKVEQASSLPEATKMVAPHSYTLIDRWILERLHSIVSDCLAGFAAYDFRKVVSTITQFVSGDLSALYIDITKDRMYCDAENSPRRRATQAAIREITETLTKLLAPILAYTADETWEFLGHADSVHLQDFPQPNETFANAEAGAAVEDLLKARAVIQQAIEAARQAKKIGSNLEATVKLTLPEAGFAHAIFSDLPALQEFFILSDLHLTRGPDLAATVEVCTNPKCERCWKLLPDVGTIAEHPTLCGRCAEAVG
ncbi:isoleucine--tRNA ligase [Brevifollis gellanilyticus]|uniref:Isoleucine--tRNA ligase n=1 Tax=Brevifollis gellanilyticus TaxID=748831 RepID=A0A512M3I1_9BACT|nr:isoleucine--tRNA ligase [Brevifollis gellanilyticus]GEP41307.1 isoleucine--tRNA ligase [Brevifollis gellanilyticus]